MSRKLLASAAFFVSTTAAAGPPINSARVTGNIVSVRGTQKSAEPDMCAIEIHGGTVEVPVFFAAVEGDRCTVAREDLPVPTIEAVLEAAELASDEAVLARRMEE